MTNKYKIKRVRRINEKNVLRLSPLPNKEGEMLEQYGQGTVEIVVTDQELTKFKKGDHVEVSIKSLGAPKHKPLADQTGESEAEATETDTEPKQKKTKDNSARAVEINDTMSKEEIEKKLDKLKVDYPASSHKADLAELLADKEK